MDKFLFTTARLGFRYWQANDFTAFHRLNSSEKVMEYFPTPLSLVESRHFWSKLEATFATHQFGYYAVEERVTGAFIGFIGLMPVTMPLDFAPCVEIGWRLLPNFWNQGYATEGAQRCLAYGKQELDLSEIYSFTATVNKPSERIMQKIGMQKLKTFLHPKLPTDHWLAPHVLYRWSPK